MRWFTPKTLRLVAPYDQIVRVIAAEETAPSSESQPASSLLLCGSLDAVVDVATLGFALAALALGMLQRECPQGGSSTRPLSFVTNDE